MTNEDLESETKFFLRENEKLVEIFNQAKLKDDNLKIKVYRKRWLILLIYILFSFGNKSQYLQYTMVSNVIRKYYNVSTLAVKGTAMVYNLSVPIAIYPCTLMINRWGLRYVIILASTSTCIGTWIKYISIDPDRYVLTLIGQIFVGAWQVVVLSTPGCLAARWFGPREVATATALCFFGIKVGSALLSLIMPIVVRMHENVDDIGKDLKNLLLPQAIYCTCVALIVVVFFAEDPKLPPSNFRALQKLNAPKKNKFWSSLLRLLKNKNYVLLLIAQSLVFAQLMSIMSSLNGIYLIHFENGEKDVGKIGLIIFLSGFVGSVVFSKILDKTKMFKTISIIVYAGCLLSLVLLGICFYNESRWAVFVAAGIYGIFCFGYHPISVEVSVEMSYPVPESFSIAVLLLGSQFFVSSMLVISDKILLFYNDVALYVLCFGTLLIGFILTILTKDVRNRQDAGKC